MSEPDWIYKEIRAEYEKATLSVDFLKMPSGVTLTGTPSELIVVALKGLDTAPDNIVSQQPTIGTVTGANCALIAKVQNTVQGEVYQFVWKCGRSDGDIAVAVTNLPSI